MCCFNYPHFHLLYPKSEENMITYNLVLTAHRWVGGCWWMWGWQSSLSTIRMVILELKFEGLGRIVDWYFPKIPHFLFTDERDILSKMWKLKLALTLLSLLPRFKTDFLLSFPPSFFFRFLFMYITHNSCIKKHA